MSSGIGGISDAPDDGIIQVNNGTGLCLPAVSQRGPKQRVRTRQTVSAIAGSVGTIIWELRGALDAPRELSSGDRAWNKKFGFLVEWVSASLHFKAIHSTPRQTRKQMLTTVQRP